MREVKLPTSYGPFSSHCRRVCHRAACETTLMLGRPRGPWCHRWRVPRALRSGRWAEPRLWCALIGDRRVFGTWHQVRWITLRVRQFIHNRGASCPCRSHPYGHSVVKQRSCQAMTRAGCAWVLLYTPGQSVRMAEQRGCLCSLRQVVCKPNQYFHHVGADRVCQRGGGPTGQPT